MKRGAVASIWVIGVVFALFLAAWLAVSFILSAQADQRVAVMQAVSEQLGFSIGAPYAPKRGALRFEAVAADFPAATAGLLEGDVVRWRSADTLYRRLLDAQGATATLPICRHGAALDVTLVVPTLELPADPDRLLWATWADRSPLGCE